jgi:predicted dinucleotide-binding enzyme
LYVQPIKQLENNQPMKKNIGIIGSGVVAQALGSGFRKHGYDVKLGTRDASKLKDWQEKEGHGATLGTVEQAAAFGDILVLAVKGTAAKEALKMAGEDHLSGKTIIDATNPIAEEAPENGVLRFFTDINKSLMEDLQESFPNGNFVKSFSCIGNAFMVNPPFEDQPTMFIAGNDESAKNEVKLILDQFGWDVADMGTAEAARAIEPLCILWCIPGFRENSWTHAFKMVRL